MRTSDRLGEETLNTTIITGLTPLLASCAPELDALASVYEARPWSPAPAAR